MKNLQFKSAKAKNFFSIGNKGIEIDFIQFGNIILIQGINLDTGTRAHIHSNGAGKSTLIDILSYGIYGKTVKNPKKLTLDDPINVVTGANLEIEIIVDDYKIIRRRSPDSVQLFQLKNNEWDDISLGAGKTKTNELIEEKIGLSHAAFCAIVVTDDSGKHTFLQLDPAGKRSIVENILNLDCYKMYHENAKEYLKNIKKTIKETTDKYSQMGDSIDEIQKKIVNVQTQETTWFNQKNKDIELIKTKITSKQKDLAALDADGAMQKYNSLFEKNTTSKEKLEEGLKQKEKLEASIETAKKSQNDRSVELNGLVLEAQNITNLINKINSEKKECETIITSLKALKQGTKCDKCFGEINEKNAANYITLEQNKLTALIDNLDKTKAKAGLLTTDINSKKAKADELNKILNTVLLKLKDVNLLNQNLSKEIEAFNKLEKPNVSVSQQVLEKEILLYKTDLGTKEQEILISPYKEIIQSAIKSKEEKQVQSDLITKSLRESEKLLPYGEFFVEAFGDNGIRKSVIDGIIPPLNESIDFWLETLIDGNYKLTLDNELTEHLTIGNVETKYHALSNGEKTRCNLAISQGWGYVGTLSAGKIPSIAFLDEITGGGIDVAGVKGIYRMIMELSKDRQVLLTTHNQTLIDMLQGHETLTVVKENGISFLEN